MIAVITKLSSSDLLIAFKGESITDRFFRCFWLLGPFFMLWERTPADIWLSIIGLAFIIKSFVEKDFSWLNHLWVKLCFCFWFSCIVSSIFSFNPSLSVPESVVWFRFPLFAFATVFWLGTASFI